VSVIIVLDLETTVQFGEDKSKDNSPYNPKNKIVSSHWRMIEDGVLHDAQRAIFNHNEQNGLDADSSEAMKQDISRAELMVCHNAKFDGSYLLESGFSIPKTVYCTMIGEYVFARGQRQELSLKATAERRDVTRKKSDLVDGLFKSGTGFEAMPLATVIEYADADVLSTAEIYLAQQKDLLKESNVGLLPTFTLMNEMLLFLVELERNGIAIDRDTLAEVKTQFEAEKAQIEKDLDFIVADVMGDTPVNLNSGVDMTAVVYSRRVNDRNYHKNAFNIGLNARGKPLPPPRMNASQFANTVRKSTRRVMRTIANHCDVCAGDGRLQKTKVNGDLYKNLSKCTHCDGRGYTLTETGQVAGLKLIPTQASDASINGFKTDKVTIAKLIAQAHAKDNLKAVEFLTKTSRLNAISTYLDSFVKNIQASTRADGLLHAQFNQCITRTGRLSSSQPNFQNIPKGHKFPVRKAVHSRFEGGTIMEADFSGLEFRVAGELSRDPQIIEDIESGKDVHKQTASIINQCAVEDVDKTMRQNAKAYTFAPLYGGMGANEPPHVQAYFKEYFNIYKGLALWHRKLMDGVLKDGLVRIPSGREFYFPNARRLGNGRITNATAVVNYPCQSFATADLVVMSCVRAHERFKDEKFKSRLILTVHDSIVVDVHPDEDARVIEALKWAMGGLAGEVSKRYDYDLLLPLDIEITQGPNWMEQVELIID
jgi:DNA polymerase I-like protein with 3'-5' exonuclease and polymerase domains